MDREGAGERPAKEHVGSRRGGKKAKRKAELWVQTEELKHFPKSRSSTVPPFAKERKTESSSLTKSDVVKPVEFAVVEKQQPSLSSCSARNPEVEKGPETSQLTFPNETSLGSGEAVTPSSSNLPPSRPSQRTDEPSAVASEEFSSKCLPAALKRLSAPVGNQALRPSWLPRFACLRTADELDC